MTETEIYDILKAAGGDMMGLEHKATRTLMLNTKTGEASQGHKEYWQVRGVEVRGVEVSDKIAHAITDTAAREVWGKECPGLMPIIHEVCGIEVCVQDCLELMGEATTLRKAVALALKGEK